METERLELLPPSLERASLMLEAIQESHNELGVYLPWVPHALTDEASIENTKQAIQNFEAYEGELRYSIIEKASGKLLGAIGLIIKDKAVPYFEIGYWLRTSAYGYGYMTEAVNRLTDYALQELHANRLEITVAETNYPSRAVAERCGYEFECLKKNERRLPSGELCHTVIYSKTSA
ncbi:GNAT family N-acetyltransferase [Photobacterium lutimaris]|uniref:GNAT family N-acetyltransferase n=1 Tax=Photobacterium lutimaris TaxID=388278 RepID=A0A2T3J437_9GAMM|nr:GNAT family N-acetyltransferase [Photobacterium lutimaris]PSU36062.1 GNAT family N-acetyltransferase [Photobacterium lutimaris]TDR79163.1 RimJ/RimL family protein N-acetyltransferase [Photobacterium lutimaris]